MPFLAAAMLVGASGCKSGVERDIVQREMRRQEDQIYMLEDSLTEYQQLVSQYRQENMALEEQLMSQSPFDRQPSRERDRGRSTPSSTRTPAAAPGGRNGLTPDESEPAEPAAPPLKFNVPDVPALEDTSSSDVEFVPRDAVAARPAAEAAAPLEPATAVALRGEVSFDAPADGPRVLVDVVPLTEAGQPAEHGGSLSLLVLDPQADNSQAHLARWDFRAEELEQFARGTADRPMFEFPLQLPADVLTGRPVELWVRLVPEGGSKVLGRTTVDLGRPGHFATARRQPPRPKDRVVRTAAVEAPVASSSHGVVRLVDRAVRQSDWHVARPGETTPADRRDAPNDSTWRVATQPLPIVESHPPRRSPTSCESPPRDRYGDDIDPAIRKAPRWSPERTADGTDRNARPREADVKQPPIDHIVPPPRPAWSPTR